MGKRSSFSTVVLTVTDAAVLQAETFETVKSNIYNLLVELAFDFSAEQLDLLFDKFESARGRPAADTVKVAQLLCKIAEADVDVRSPCWQSLPFASLDIEKGY